VSETAAQMGEPGRTGFFGTLRTVLFGALGVRRRADHDRESQTINPLHLVIAAVLFAAMFVFTLVAIVSVVTR
jgi:hypothetical protein